jgi:hypothetical protein
MEYLNNDIALNISRYIKDIKDMKVLRETCKIFRDVVRYYIDTADITYNKQIVVCMDNYNIGYCGSKHNNTAKYCFSRHTRSSVPVHDLQIKCTIGQFVTEILPYVSIQSTISEDSVRAKVYVCYICNHIITAYFNERIYTKYSLRISNNTIYVKGVYLCRYCDKTSTAQIFSYRVKNSSCGEICLTADCRTPSINSLSRYKILKDSYYIYRRKKYNFVFV